MYGKIKEIKEVENVRLDGEAWSSQDGYEVITTKTSIYVLIDNGQSCCEKYGYFSSDDDLNQFIGAKLKEITLTDIALNTKTIEFVKELYLYAGGIQFVTFNTNKGLFQLAVYNAHNGYYGHDIQVVVGDDVILTDRL